MRYIFLGILLIAVCYTTFAQEGTIKDIDGNEYRAGKIGTQFWMLENLKTTHYRDGSIITEIEDKSKWTDEGEHEKGAWCYYDKNTGNNPTYGKLYNWYSVVDKHRLCPTGWHVPSDAEFTILISYLGGDQVAGGKMKAQQLWNSPNTGADNFSHFSALPSGDRYVEGSFYNLGVKTMFWTSTEFNCIGAIYRTLYSDNSTVGRFFEFKGEGYPVRCVAD